MSNFERYLHRLFPEFKTQTGFWLAIAGLVVVGALQYWAIQGLRQADFWVLHTHQVTADAEGLYSALTQIESDGLEYAATGNADYAREYDADVARGRMHLEALRNLTVDNPQQRANLGKISPLVQETIDSNRQLIALRRQQRIDAAQLLAAQADSLKQMNELRDAFHDILSEEKRLLADRLAQSRTRAKIADSAIVLGVLLALVLSILAGLIMRRDTLRGRQTEDALAAERHLLKTLMDNLPDVIFFKDLESGFTLVNQAQAKLFGLRDPAQAVGKTDFDFFTVSHAQTAFDDEQEIIRTGRPLVGKEEQEARPDGSVTWVSTTKLPLRDASGNIVGTFGVSRDITQLKQSQESLRESEERFRSLVENATVGIFRASPEGQLIMANSALVRMLGYGDFEALAAHNSADDGIEFPYSQRTLLERMEKSIQGKGLEQDLKRADGSLIFIRETAQAIRSKEGKILFYDGIVEDNTERKALEQQLHQAAKMQAVGQLAGGVAHDFNNLLTIITGYSEILTEKLTADPKVTGYLKEISDAGERATSLTRQLLAFSRRQVLTPQILNLNSVVANVEKMLRRLIGEDIKLHTILNESIGRVKADPGQIEQVIMNLAVNARDAMPAGGKLTIETSQVELDAAFARSHPTVIPGTHVMLAVIDSGEGMTAATQEHIFEPFFTTKELGRGTGLGLATVYGIVKQSGGSIWVYSELGHGTAFEIYLPVVTESPAPSESARVELGPATGTETILVIEDEDAVRSLIRLALVSGGYKVLEAPGTQRALAICADYKGPIHLLLTDVVMPQMSGPAVAAKVSALRPGIKVLYMSGYTDDAVASHGVLSQEMPFIHKPLSPGVLRRKVREVLGG